MDNTSVTTGPSNVSGRTCIGSPSVGEPSAASWSSSHTYLRSASRSPWSWNHKRLSRSVVCPTMVCAKSIGSPAQPHEHRDIEEVGMVRVIVHQPLEGGRDVDVEDHGRGGSGRRAPGSKLDRPAHGDEGDLRHDGSAVVVVHWGREEHGE